jgi:hypothetical protein
VNIIYDKRFSSLALLASVLLITLGTILSRNYVPQLGLVGSLNYMQIVIVEGKTVPPKFETKPGNPNPYTGAAMPEIKITEKGYTIKPIAIPTKYVYILAILIIGVGLYGRIMRGN